MSAQTPLVSIVGAGPGGLLLARYLQLHAVPVVVYERESSATARSQGGSLDLHEGTGLTALEHTGLLEKAKERMRPEGEAMRILGKDGKVWWDEVGEDGQMKQSSPHGRPEIDRTDLRELLLASLEPDTIKWNHGVTSARAINNDLYELTFESQPSTTTTILVGADGTFSRIRSLLHNTRPAYSGLTMYELLIPTHGMTPAIRSVVGPGTSMILDDYKGLFLQMNSGGKCRVYASLQVDESWLEANPLPKESKREWLASHYEGWVHARDIILACNEEEIVPRKIWQFDPFLKWSTELTGVTIIGDAAHVMSPFAGEGVNQALADGLILGQTLVPILRPSLKASLAPFPLSFLPLAPPPSSIPTLTIPRRSTIHDTLRRFERRMMARVRPEMIGAAYNFSVCFGGPDGARRFRNLFYLMPIYMVLDVIASIPSRVRDMFVSMYE